MLPSLSYDEEADYPGCPNRPSDGDDGDVDGDIDQIKSWLLLAIKKKIPFFLQLQLILSPHCSGQFNDAQFLFCSLFLGFAKKKIHSYIVYQMYVSTDKYYSDYLSLTVFRLVHTLHI